MFCTRVADFTHHFGEPFHAAEILDELERRGFVREIDADYVLTAAGEEIVARFSQPEISKFAQLLRPSSDIAERFADKTIEDETEIELVEGDENSIEFRLVERPFIEQLQMFGWKYLKGDKFVPELTERRDFREVILRERLENSLRKINGEWLDETRINQAISDLEKAASGGNGLVETNRAVTKMLRVGTYVAGTEDYNDGRERPVSFIDFDEADNNDFLAVNQFRINTAGGTRYVVADIVLFINGIPIVVIECKSPGLTNPIADGIAQLRRYMNQNVGELTDVNLGGAENLSAEKLFYYNQILVSTCFYEARAGSLTATGEHFLEWKDVYPWKKEKLAEILKVDKLSSQQTLIAGMFTRENLLRMIRSFILFQETGGKIVKIIPRYTQFRTVEKIIEKLKTGKTRIKQGEQDERGGIVWHTQGSGKSLTMVYLIRRMRDVDDLRNFKIVIVTDRNDLQRQLATTAALTGEKIHEPGNINRLVAELKTDDPDVIFATIQKMRPNDEDEAEDTTESDDIAIADELSKEGVLNPSEKILLLVDEAHRSHSSKLHAALMRALPNAAKIGFTGTPILMGKQKRTTEIFGDYLDRYTILESERDGATVPIFYERRKVEGTTVDEQKIDFYFEREFADRPASERAQIIRHNATQPNVSSSLKMIAAKAKDILRHYVSVVLPDGFKAQIVATNRRAAVRYQQALVKAKEDLIERIKNSQEYKEDEKDFLENARKHLPIIEQLEFAAIISGGKNDPQIYEQWTNSEKQKSYIERFKKPLCKEHLSAVCDNLAFLCVSDMLITGFDAPIEAVLYLDKNLQTHRLLQTIARVNRTYSGKASGLIVDYEGITQKLKESLAVYTAEDVKGALLSIKDELPLLFDRHARARAVFAERGIDFSTDGGIDKAIELLEDKKIRADFNEKLKLFLQVLNTILPRPEALTFIRDAERLAFISRVAARHYRDEQVNLAGVGEKVREIIDEYVEAKGIHIEIPPVSVTDIDFAQEIDRNKSDRLKASEMEHAIRFHLNKHLQEDPVFYKRLSERLREILTQFADDPASRLEPLKKIIEDINTGRPPNEFGLDEQIEARFYDVILEESQKDKNLDYSDREKLAGFTVELVEFIRKEIIVVNFWRGNFNRENLAKRIAEKLVIKSIVKNQKAMSVADLIVELAKTLHSNLVK